MKTSIHLKKICVLLLLNLIILSLAAQPSFMKVYNALTYSFGYSAKPTSDNGFIVIGETRDSAINIRSILLEKIDSSGAIQWGKIYGTSDDAICSAIVPTSDKGYIMTGFVIKNGGADYDLLLLKTDSLGNPEWSKSYGGSPLDQGSSVIETSDSGFIAVGRYYTQHNNVFIIKTDAHGNLTWTKVLNSFNDTGGGDMKQTPDSGYIIGGFAYGYDSFLLFKIDGTGTVLWSKSYFGSGLDFLNDIEVTKDSGFILCGRTKSFGNGNEDAFLTKTDALGNITWSKAYGKLVNDRGSDVVVTPDGGYVFTGHKETSGTNAQNSILIKTDSIGNVEWSKRLDGFSIHNSLNSVTSTADSGFIFCGTSAYGPFNDTGLLLVKSDGNGITLCHESGYALTTTNAPFNTIAYSLPPQNQPVSSDTVIFTVTNVANVYDVCAVTGIFENHSASLVSVFPNPSRGHLVLKSSEHLLNAYIIFLNAIGEKVFTAQLKDEAEQNINAGMLPAGLYFAEVRNGNKIFRDKVMIIKN